MLGGKHVYYHNALDTFQDDLDTYFYQSFG